MTKFITERELHPYQLETRDAVISAIHRGVTRPMIVLPTGMGKTIVFSHVAKAMDAPRTLVIAHREELLIQARDKLLMCWPGVDVGIVQGERNEHDRQVVAASIQTLVRPNRRLQMDPFDFIVVDECHHASADSYRTVLSAFGAFDQGGPPVLGVTATPDRGDGRGLDSVFQEIVKQIPILWGIENGYLVDLVGISCKLNIDLDAIRSTAGDFSEGDLSRAMLEAAAPEYVYEAYHEHADGRRAIVFTPTVEVARAVAEAFQDRGESADWISGETEDRADVLDRFKAGEIRVLANCAVLTEGYDDPTLDCVIMARPTRSRALYTQCVGRGTRPAPGKQNCIVIDLVGNSKRHSLQSMGALFGVDDGESVLEKKEREKKPLVPVAKPQIDLDFTDFTIESEVTNLFQASNLIWNSGIRSGYRTWSIFLGDEGVVTLTERPDLGVYRLTHDQAGAIRHVGDFDRRTPLENIIQQAEGFVQRLGGLAYVRANKQGSWRNEPATDKQKNMLKAAGISFKPGITKGQASELINKVQARRQGGGSI